MDIKGVSLRAIVALGRSCILTTLTIRRATKAIHSKNGRVIYADVARVTGIAVDVLTIWRVWDYILGIGNSGSKQDSEQHKKIPSHKDC